MEEIKRVICKRLNFDGCNFWVEDCKVGEISPELRFTEIPKEVMFEEKNKIVGKIVEMR